MKNLISILLLVCFTLCAISCDQQNPGTESAEQSVESTTFDSDSADSSAVVSTPEELPIYADESERYRFKSFEAFAELKAMLDKSDEEVEKILSEDRKLGSSKRYPSRIFTKKDIQRMFEAIGDLDILILDDGSNYSFIQLVYFLDIGYVDIYYHNGEYGVRPVSWKKTEEAINENPAGEFETRELVGTIELQQGSIDLYDITFNETGGKLSGLIETDTTFINLIFYDPIINPELGKLLRMTTINEIIEEMK